MPKSFKVLHSGNAYDVEQFLKNHPGGTNYVQPYKDKEVTKRMVDTCHSPAAFYLLREYKLGGRDNSEDNHPEDLEKLVDWDKPMLSQVTSLGARYNEWVNSPVDRHLRLFGNPILENLTITPWYVVPIIWIPVSLYFICIGIQKYTERHENLFSLLVSMFFVGVGITIWTLVEYSLHRWLFHRIPSGESKIQILVHFTIHGLHHKVPFDTQRLVFPPVPAAMVVFVGYNIYKVLLPDAIFEMVAGGTILGYVIYDMIHFYIHHGSPEEGTYLYTLKRYHNQHHFSQHESGFGISSQSWDFVFGTLIKLKKLTFGIRW